MGVRVRLQDVSKHYRDFIALKGLSLDVAPGEVLSILGPSGSGKTTALMLLAGIIQPTAGRIQIGERDITTLPSYLRDIGVVFQNYALFPHMTVFDNVAFPLRRRGRTSAQIAAEVGEALQLVRLNGHERHYIRQLSGGMQQRVALARALVFRPSLLVMDEPLGALDKQLREHMQVEIKQITRAVGITTIYVTHDQEEALSLSDRVAVLRGGVLQQLGTPESLYNAPVSRFVAEFVGSTNVVEGDVVREDGHAILRSTDGLQIPLPRSCTAGGRVAVSIRPERIRFGTGFDAPVKLNGRITDRIFAGGTVKYRVDVGGAFFSVCTGNDGINARPGEEVSIGWRTEDAHVLSADPFDPQQP